MSLTVTPSNLDLIGDESVGFVASEPVAWSADFGEITSLGNYTAPNRTGIYTVTARSGTETVTAVVRVLGVLRVTPTYRHPRAFGGKSLQVALPRRTDSRRKSGTRLKIELAGEDATTHEMQALEEFFRLHKDRIFIYEDLALAVRTRFVFSSSLRYRQTGVDSYSWEITVESVGVLDVPSDLRVRVVVADVVTLEWTNPEFVQVGILYRLANGSWAQFGGFTRGTAATITGLTEATLYEFKLRTIDGSETETVTATTGLRAPSNATAEFVASAVTLNWTRNSIANTGVRIRRDGVQIASLAAGTTTYTDTGRDQSTAYVYEIENFKGGVVSLPVQLEVFMWRVGDYRWSADSSPGAGWLACDDTEYNASAYPALAALLGTYQVEGVSKFRTPNSKGRMFVVAGAGTDLTNRTIGQIGGAETVSLTAAQNGQHSHSYTIMDGPGTSPGIATDANNGPANLTTGNSGEGAPHENMPPFFVGGHLHIRAL